jgi:hypothetical protein
LEREVLDGVEIDAIIRGEELPTPVNKDNAKESTPEVEEQPDESNVSTAENPPSDS